MKSVFALLCGACGLTIREAAAYLKTPNSTVSAWVAGQRTPSESAVNQMVALAAQIESAAAERLGEIRRQAATGGAPPVIELVLASDDTEAVDLGWPCVGAQAASVGRLIVAGMQDGYKFSTVPYGSSIVSVDYSGEKRVK